MASSSQKRKLTGERGLAQESISIKRLNDQGYGLEIEFTWADDRFGHDVFFLHENERAKFLSSVEGTTSDTWPPSPPLQQISEQSIAGDRAIMGVGMAGHSHWSASFLLKNEEGQLTLLCELACLTKTPNNEPNQAENGLSAKVTGQQICSNYEVFKGWKLEDAAKNNQYCRFDNAAIENRFSPLLNTEISPVNPTKIQASTGKLTLLPVPESNGASDAASSTIQWGYRIWLP